MVESPNYYRSYQPIFKTLQSLDVDNLSFKEELVKLKKGRLPEFLHPSHTIDSHIVHKISKTWEQPKRLIRNSTIENSPSRSNQVIEAAIDLPTLPTEVPTGDLTNSQLSQSNLPTMTPNIPHQRKAKIPTILHKDLSSHCSSFMGENYRITLQEFFDTPYSEEQSIFDSSQEQAVKTCLQNRIGIIQGPPGCGKTFIGIQMVRLLLSLSSLYKPKIFVLTYKNHALDEFLKGIGRLVLLHLTLSNSTFYSIRSLIR